MSRSADAPEWPKVVELLVSLKDYGLVGLLLFGAVVVVGSSLCLPRPLVCLVGGFAFGWIALPLVLIASTIGSALAFLAARYLLRERVQAAVATRPVAAAALHAIDRYGWRLVFLLRLGTPIPSAVMNCAAGLTGIGLRDFVGATCLGTALPVFVFVQIGTAGRLSLDDQQGTPLLMSALGIVCTIAVALIVVRAARMRLRAMPAV